MWYLENTSLEDESSTEMRQQYSAKARARNQAQKLSQTMVAEQALATIGKGHWGLGDGNHAIAASIINPLISTKGFVKQCDKAWHREHESVCDQFDFHGKDPKVFKQSMGWCATLGPQNLDPECWKNSMSFMRNMVRIIQRNSRRANGRIDGKVRHLLLCFKHVNGAVGNETVQYHAWLSARPMFNPYELDMIPITIPSDPLPPFHAKLMLQCIPAQPLRVPVFKTMEAVGQRIAELVALPGKSFWQMLSYSLSWREPLAHLRIDEFKTWTDWGLIGFV
jgi:hypothetical protein